MLNALPQRCTNEFDVLNGLPQRCMDEFDVLNGFLQAEHGTEVRLIPHF